jgi:hypothetical protein
LETRHFGDVRLHIKEIIFAKELTVVFKVTIVGVPALFTLKKGAELLLPFEYRTKMNY